MYKRQEDKWGDDSQEAHSAFKTLKSHDPWRFLHVSTGCKILQTTKLLSVVNFIRLYSCVMGRCVLSVRNKNRKTEGRKNEIAPKREIGKESSESIFVTD